MTTKTIEEIRKAARGMESYVILSDAIDELAALRAQVQELTAERDTARTTTEGHVIKKTMTGGFGYPAHITVKFASGGVMELRNVGADMYMASDEPMTTGDAVEAEREACAAICEANAAKQHYGDPLYHAHMTDARDIRARKNTPSPREGDNTPDENGVLDGPS